MQDHHPSPDHLKLDAPALNAFLAEAFPHADDDSRAKVLEVSPGEARLRINAGEANLRPGRLVAGPTLMALADVAAYAMVLAHVGPVAMAVTTSLTLHFLRGCPPGAVTAHARLVRLGKRIVTVDVTIFSEGSDKAVAQGIVAYALP